MTQARDLVGEARTQARQLVQSQTERRTRIESGDRPRTFASVLRVPNGVMTSDLQDSL